MKLVMAALGWVVVWTLAVAPALGAGAQGAAPAAAAVRNPPATSFPAIPEAQRKRIAVMPFDDRQVARASWWGPDWHVGPGVSDMLVSSLVKSNAFRVVEREQLDKVIAEQQLGKAGVVDPATAVRVGKVLGVQYIITGGVTEFGLETRGGSIGSLGRVLGGIAAKQTQAKVAFDCRLVDTTTAEIAGAWTGRGEEKRASAAVGFSKVGSVAFGSADFEKTILGQATRKALEGAVKQIVNAAYLAPIPCERSAVRGLVAYVDASEITINLGRAAGVKVGDRLQISRKVQEVKDPETGELLRVITQPLCVVRVTEVEERWCSAKVLEIEGEAVKVEQGDIVRFAD